MSRRPWAIRPSLISRAISGVRKSGSDVQEITVTKDGFSVVLVAAGTLSTETDAPVISAKLDHREVEPA